MGKVRYSDEKYLCEYDLSVDFFESLGLDVIDLWPNRNIYVLDTKQGKKILKMIEYPIARLDFICIDYIKKDNELEMVRESLKFKEYVKSNYGL